MSPESQKLFLNSLEHLLEGYNKSYPKTITLKLVVTEDDHGILIHQHDSHTIDNTVVEIIDAACRNICAANYFITSRNDQPMIRIC